jgi:hypothetical protein
MNGIFFLGGAEALTVSAVIDAEYIIIIIMTIIIILLIIPDLKGIV